MTIARSARDTRDWSATRRVRGWRGRPSPHLRLHVELRAVVEPKPLHDSHQLVRSVALLKEDQCASAGEATRERLRLPVSPDAGLVAMELAGRELLKFRAGEAVAHALEERAPGAGSGERVAHQPPSPRSGSLPMIESCSSSS